MAALPYFVSRVSAFAAIRMGEALTAHGSASINWRNRVVFFMTLPSPAMHRRDRAPLPEGHMQVRRLRPVLGIQIRNGRVARRRQSASLDNRSYPPMPRAITLVRAGLLVCSLATSPALAQVAGEDLAGPPQATAAAGARHPAAAFLAVADAGRPTCAGAAVHRPLQGCEHDRRRPVDAGSGAGRASADDRAAFRCDRRATQRLRHAGGCPGVSAANACHARERRRRRVELSGRSSINEVVDSRMMHCVRRRQIVGSRPSPAMTRERGGAADG